MIKDNYVINFTQLSKKKKYWLILLKIQIVAKIVWYLLLFYELAQPYAIGFIWHEFLRASCNLPG